MKRKTESSPKRQIHETPPPQLPDPERFDALPPEAMQASCQVTVSASVVQAIHRHARASMDAEVCGVLIGEERPEGTLVEAAIAGENAAQGGAHVTFTQDTWEHIYSVKDREYPDKRIVGWYHSHPGFGIFLSRHDAFIHENFFSAAFQVAWVFDPHSEEEGCFGWVDGELRRLSAIRVIDTKHATEALLQDEPEHTVAPEDAGQEDKPEVTAHRSNRSRLRKRLVLLFSMALVFVAGVAAGLMLLPRTLVMYSFPDGRLLSEAETRVAVERALQLQREMRERGLQSGAETGGAAAQKEATAEGSQREGGHE
ncbi:MAG: Mov34/MPN/PAD-1 family protein [Bryobacterales bacterium]|nr:Mov34/MPN/PAD-1 family protein [Bryobacterales bacterium]